MNESYNEQLAKKRLAAGKRAIKKAEKINTATAAPIPLYADQLEPADIVQPQALYDQWKHTKTMVAETRADLEWSDPYWKPWVIGHLKRIARKHLGEHYPALEAKRWKEAYEREWWIARLTTTEPVILAHKVKRILGPISYFTTTSAKGETLHHVIGERIVFDDPEAQFPPPGWTPPLTRQELDAMLYIPPPTAHPAEITVDPWGLL